MTWGTPYGRGRGGAKHSPPGHQGAPNCPEGGPPLDVPETPLLPHNFPGTSPIQEFSTSIPMIFNALSNGPSLVSRCVRDPLSHRHIFAKIIKNHEKSLFLTFLQDASASISQSVEMFWSDPRCSSIDIINVHKTGAKHSPPGHQGAPDCPGAHPPVYIPETPLSHHNFPGTSSIQESKIPIIMIFNVLSDGPSPVSRFEPHPLGTRHVFAKIFKNHE